MDLLPKLVVRANARWFPAMSTTLTVSLDAELLQYAELKAKAHQTTLPEVMAKQLRVMARNWQDSRAAAFAYHSFVANQQGGGDFSDCLRIQLHH